MFSKFFQSNIVLAIIILVVSFFVLNPPLHNILTYDIVAHHIYLPLLFDQHDLILQSDSYLQSVNEVYHVSPVFYQFVAMPDGVHISKCTMGWAMLQLPFYLIAELWASLADFPTDGFSYPYRVMMFIGSWFYSMLGLVFMRKVLLHFFSDKLTSLLLLLTVFGTNIFYQFSYSVGQSNQFALFAFALMLWCIIRFYKKSTIRNAVFFAASWALLTLIRPPDGILGLLFFFWRVNSWADFKTEFVWFFNTNRKFTLWIASTFILVFSPQMIYWYCSTGSFFLNSYSNNNGEGLDFIDPYLYEFIFSFRKGWLIYTPLMIFAFIGTWFMIRKSPQGRAFTFIGFLFLYVIASWTCWWYGSTFSSRAAIDMYPLCAVLMGFALMHLFSTRQKWFWGAVIVLMVCLNIFQTYQVSMMILHGDRMTAEYYFSTFLQTTAPTPEQHKLLAFDRDQAYLDGFHESNPDYVCVSSFDKTFDEAVVLNSEKNYAPESRLETSERILKSHCWLKITWQYDTTHADFTDLVFYTSVKYGKHGNYSWAGYTINDKNVQHDSINGTVSFYYLTPVIRTRWDDLVFGAMKHKGDSIRLLGHKVEFYEPKEDND